MSRRTPEASDGGTYDISRFGERDLQASYPFYREPAFGPSSLQSVDLFNFLGRGLYGHHQPSQASLPSFAPSSIPAPPDRLPLAGEIVQPLINSTTLLPRHYRPLPPPIAPPSGVPIDVGNSQQRLVPFGLPQSSMSLPPLDSAAGGALPPASSLLGKRSVSDMLLTAAAEFDASSSSSDDDRRPKTREQARAEQQRQASRRYRQKKKQCTEQLEKRLLELQEEKSKTQSELDAARTLIQRLQEENAALRKEHHVQSIELERERMQLLDELDALVRADVPDEQLLPCLAAIKDCCRRISELGICHVSLLVSPVVASALVKNGFFESIESQIEIEPNTDGVAHFCRRVLAAIQHVTAEQRDRMLQHVSKHYDEMFDLAEERRMINAEIAAYFAMESRDRRAEPPDVPRMLQMMSALEILRNNLREEAVKVAAVLAAIVNELDPRQQAQFYLEVEFQHRSVQQLKTLWTAMHPSGAPSSSDKCPQ